MINPSLKSLRNEQLKGNEFNRVFIYLQKHTATASMVAAALNIYRPNVCRHKRKLEKAGRLAETKKGVCQFTKHRAAYLTTNPDLFPIQSQLNLFV